MGIKTFFTVLGTQLGIFVAKLFTILSTTFAQFFILFYIFIWLFLLTLILSVPINFWSENHQLAFSAVEQIHSCTIEPVINTMVLPIVTAGTSTYETIVPAWNAYQMLTKKYISGNVLHLARCMNLRTVVQASINLIPPFARALGHIALSTARVFIGVPDDGLMRANALFMNALSEWIVAFGTIVDCYCSMFRYVSDSFALLLRNEHLQCVIASLYRIPQELSVAIVRALFHGMWWLQDFGTWLGSITTWIIEGRVGPKPVFPSIVSSLTPDLDRSFDNLIAGACCFGNLVDDILRSFLELFWDVFEEYIPEIPLWDESLADANSTLPFAVNIGGLFRAPMPIVVESVRAVYMLLTGRINDIEAERIIDSLDFFVSELGDALATVFGRIGIAVKHLGLMLVRLIRFLALIIVNVRTYKDYQQTSMACFTNELYYAGEEIEIGMNYVFDSIPDVLIENETIFHGEIGNFTKKFFFELPAETIKFVGDFTKKLDNYENYTTLESDCFFNALIESTDTGGELAIALLKQHPLNKLDNQLDILLNTTGYTIPIREAVEFETQLIKILIEILRVSLRNTQHTTWSTWSFNHNDSDILFQSIRDFCQKGNNLVHNATTLDNLGELTESSLLAFSEAFVLMYRIVFFPKDIGKEVFDQNLCTLHNVAYDLGEFVEFLNVNVTVPGWGDIDVQTENFVKSSGMTLVKFLTIINEALILFIQAAVDANTPNVVHDPLDIQPILQATTDFVDGLNSITETTASLFTIIEPSLSRAVVHGGHGFTSIARLVPIFIERNTNLSETVRNDIICGTESIVLAISELSTFSFRFVARFADLLSQNENSTVGNAVGTVGTGVGRTVAYFLSLGENTVDLLIQSIIIGIEERPIEDLDLTYLRCSLESAAIQASNLIKLIDAANNGSSVCEISDVVHDGFAIITSLPIMFIDYVESGEFYLLTIFEDTRFFLQSTGNLVSWIFASFCDIADSPCHDQAQLIGNTISTIMYIPVAVFEAIVRLIVRIIDSATPGNIITMLHIPGTSFYDDLIHPIIALIDALNAAGDALDGFVDSLGIILHTFAKVIGAIFVTEDSPLAQIARSFFTVFTAFLEMLYAWIFGGDAFSESLTTFVDKLISFLVSTMSIIWALIVAFIDDIAFQGITIVGYTITECIVDFGNCISDIITTYINPGNWFRDICDPSDDICLRAQKLYTIANQYEKNSFCYKTIISIADKYQYENKTATFFEDAQIGRCFADASFIKETESNIINENKKKDITPIVDSKSNSELGYQSFDTIDGLRYTQEVFYALGNAGYAVGVLASDIFANASIRDQFMNYLSKDIGLSIHDTEYIINTVRQGETSFIDSYIKFIDETQNYGMDNAAKSVYNTSTSFIKWFSDFAKQPKIKESLSPGKVARMTDDASNLFKKISEIPAMVSDFSIVHESWLKSRSLSRFKNLHNDAYIEPKATANTRDTRYSTRYGGVTEYGCGWDSPFCTGDNYECMLADDLCPPSWPNCFESRLAIESLCPAVESCSALSGQLPICSLLCDSAYHNSMFDSFCVYDNTLEKYRLNRDGDGYFFVIANLLGFTDHDCNHIWQHGTATWTFHKTCSWTDATAAYNTHMTTELSYMLIAGYMSHVNYLPYLDPPLPDINAALPSASYDSMSALFGIPLANMHESLCYDLVAQYDERCEFQSKPIVCTETPEAYATCQRHCAFSTVDFQFGPQVCATTPKTCYYGDTSSTSCKNPVVPGAPGNSTLLDKYVLEWDLPTTTTSIHKNVVEFICPYTPELTDLMWSYFRKDEMRNLSTSFASAHSGTTFCTELCDCVDIYDICECTSLFPLNCTYYDISNPWILDANYHAKALFCSWFPPEFTIITESMFPLHSPGYITSKNLQDYPLATQVNWTLEAHTCPTPSGKIGNGITSAYTYACYMLAPDVRAPYLSSRTLTTEQCDIITETMYSWEFDLEQGRILYPYFDIMFSRDIDDSKFSRDIPQLLDNYDYYKYYDDYTDDQTYTIRGIFDNPDEVIEPWCSPVDGMCEYPTLDLTYCYLRDLYPATIDIGNCGIEEGSCSYTPVSPCERTFEYQRERFNLYDFATTYSDPIVVPSLEGNTTYTNRGLSPEASQLVTEKIQYTMKKMRQKMTLDICDLYPNDVLCTTVTERKENIASAYGMKRDEFTMWNTSVLLPLEEVRWDCWMLCGYDFDDLMDRACIWRALVDYDFAQDALHFILSIQPKVCGFLGIGDGSEFLSDDLLGQAMNATQSYMSSQLSSYYASLETSSFNSNNTSNITYADSAVCGRFERLGLRLVDWIMGTSFTTTPMSEVPYIVFEMISGLNATEIDIFIHEFIYNGNTDPRTGDVGLLYWVLWPFTTSCWKLDCKDTLFGYELWISPIFTPALPVCGARKVGEIADVLTPSRYILPEYMVLREDEGCFNNTLLTFPFVGICECNNITYKNCGDMFGFRTGYDNIAYILARYYPTYKDSILGWYISYGTNDAIKPEKFSDYDSWDAEKQKSCNICFFTTILSTFVVLTLPILIRSLLLLLFIPLALALLEFINIVIITTVIIISSSVKTDTLSNRIDDLEEEMYARKFEMTTYENLQRGPYDPIQGQRHKHKY